MSPHILLLLSGWPTPLVDTGTVDTAPVDDEDDSVNLATGSVWHPDGDLDGFGTMASSATACAAPADWTADATDCDDADATTPGHTNLPQLRRDPGDGATPCQ